MFFFLLYYLMLLVNSMNEMKKQSTQEYCDLLYSVSVLVMYQAYLFSLTVHSKTEVLGGDRSF